MAESKYQRNRLAQVFHTKVLQYLKSGDNLDLHSIGSFISENLSTLSTWAVDASHNHNDFHVTLALYHPHTEGEVGKAFKKLHPQEKAKRINNILYIIDNLVLANLKPDLRKHLIATVDGNKNYPVHLAVLTGNTAVFDKTFKLLEKYPESNLRHQLLQSNSQRQNVLHCAVHCAILTQDPEIIEQTVAICKKHGSGEL